MPNSSTILIPAGTIVGYSFQSRRSSTPVTGTVELIADAIVDAERQEDGSWKYPLAPSRVYFCAGGLATVLK